MLSTNVLHQLDPHRLVTQRWLQAHKGGLGAGLRLWQLPEFHVRGHWWMRVVFGTSGKVLLTSTTPSSSKSMPSSAMAVGYRWSRNWNTPSSLVAAGKENLLFILGFFFFFNFLNLLFIYYVYLWLCWVFVSVRGLSLVAARGGHSSSRCAGLSLSRPLLLRSTGSRRAGNCGSRAQLLRGMWDLPRPGLEPVSPALAGRLPTTAPPGKPYFSF